MERDGLRLLLLDLHRQKAELQRLLDVSEEDRAARLKALQSVGKWLEESEAARLRLEERAGQLMPRRVGEFPGES